VRAANIEAHAVMLATRDEYFFDPRHMNARQMNSNFVVVKLPDREVFLDPGTPYTPFGLLPWYETALTGLKLDQEGGEWINSPIQTPSDARVDRKLTAKLSPAGGLEGKLVVTYSGQEAAWRRLRERNQDDADRRKFLEDDVESDVPSGIEVKLTNTPDWASSDAPLVAELDFKVSGWASLVGKRALLPVGLFGGGEKHSFEHGARVHPIYFSFPSIHTDEVNIELPQGWQVTSVPKPRLSDLKGLKYTMDSTVSGNTLTLKRELMRNLVLVNLEAYPAILGFYQGVRAGDEDQVVVAPL
jgi:hypothetical protein